MPLLGQRWLPLPRVEGEIRTLQESGKRMRGHKPTSHVPRSRQRALSAPFIRAAETVLKRFLSPQVLQRNGAHESKQTEVEGCQVPSGMPYMSAAPLPAHPQHLCHCRERRLARSPRESRPTRLRIISSSPLESNASHLLRDPPKPTAPTCPLQTCPQI